MQLNDKTFKIWILGRRRLWVNFFPNFKCLWRPPILVRSSSSSGYILPRSPPSCVLGWVFCFLSKCLLRNTLLHTHCFQHNSLLPAKICNDVFQSVRSVCNSSRCSPKIAGRLSCKKSVNICANSVTVQSLRNFDSLIFHYSSAFVFSLPPVHSFQVVESKTR